MILALLLTGLGLFFGLGLVYVGVTLSAGQIDRSMGPACHQLGETCPACGEALGASDASGDPFAC